MDTVRAVAATGVPTMVMSYWNPIERFGVAAVRRASWLRPEGSGVITADITPEEAGGVDRRQRADGLGRIFLVAPSSTTERIATHHRRGIRVRLRRRRDGCDRCPRPRRIGRARARRTHPSGDHDLPICVGLGVSTGDQAAEIAAFADGVIVGSAFVRALLDARHPEDGRRAGARAGSRADLRVAASCRGAAGPP